MLIPDPLAKLQDDHPDVIITHVPGRPWIGVPYSDTLTVLEGATDEELADAIHLWRVRPVLAKIPRLPGGAWAGGAAA